MVTNYTAGSDRDTIRMYGRGRDAAPRSGGSLLCRTTMTKPALGLVRVSPSAAVGSTGKKISHHQDEDHEGEKQQNDIPVGPYGWVMHDESLLG
jgi:hypothetical protein